jgi:hypothetical protein
MCVAFRRHTLLPLDDCLYALQALIPHLGRSALHRLFQRHDISRLPDVEGDKPKRSKFKRRAIEGAIGSSPMASRSATCTSTSPSCAPRSASSGCLNAIDRTSKFAFAKLVPKAGKMAAAARLARGRRGAALQGAYRPHRPRPMFGATGGFGHRIVVASDGSSAGSSLRQAGRAVSPITNTEYARGGSHRPQDEIPSQPSGRSEHHLRDRRQPGRRLHGLMREGSFRRAPSPPGRDDRVRRP